jgi:hypothetical protein
MEADVTKYAPFQMLIIKQLYFYLLFRALRFEDSAALSL